VTVIGQAPPDTDGLHWTVSRVFPSLIDGPTTLVTWGRGPGSLQPSLWVHAGPASSIAAVNDPMTMNELRTQID